MFVRALLWLLIIVLMLIGAIAAVHYATMPAAADDAHMRQHHASADQDEWMRSLIRPDVGTSCCNLNDCGPTDAEWKDGQWWATVRGRWTPIPPEKIVESPLSIDGEAWVCALASTIFCFVPPISSY